MAAGDHDVHAGDYIRDVINTIQSHHLKYS